MTEGNISLPVVAVILECVGINMRIANGMVDEKGKIRSDIVKCEHCFNLQSYDGEKPVQDVVCNKCKMTTDKE